MIAAGVAMARLLFGGMLAKLAGFFGWLIEKPMRLAACAVMLAFAWLAWSNHSLRGDLADMTAERDAKSALAVQERANHAQTVENWRAANIASQARAEANKNAVEALWRAQFEEASNENTRLRARYRGAVADFVRNHPAPVGPNIRDSGAPGMSGDTSVPGGPVHDAALTVVPVTDLEACAVGFAQLEALIGWVDAARGVETSGE